MCSVKRVPLERWLALIVVNTGLACSSSGIRARSPDGAQARDVAWAADGAVDSVAAGTADGAVDSALDSSPDAAAPDSRAARMDAGLCGDGWIDSPDEQCDDGNTLDGDGCSSQCKFEDEKQFSAGLPRISPQSAQRSQRQTGRKEGFGSRSWWFPTI
jgi:cysteine-rich repeat protein